MAQTPNQAEDFLRTYLAYYDPREQWPRYFRLLDFEVTCQIIKHFHRRYVEQGTWSQRQLAGALHEVFGAGEKLTRAQLEKGLARWEARR